MYCDFKVILIVAGIYGLTLGRSIGSGTIIDSNGTILTCAHVVVDFQGVKASSKGNVSYLIMSYFCPFKFSTVGDMFFFPVLDILQ